MGFKEQIVAGARWVIRIFEDGAGVPSSKRIGSYFMFGFAFWIAVEMRDVALASVFLGAGLALQGITAFQK